MAEAYASAISLANYPAGDCVSARIMGQSRFLLLFFVLVVGAGCADHPTPDRMQLVSLARVIPQPERLWNVAFSPNSKAFLACGVEGVAHMYRVEDGNELRSFTHPGGVTWCVVSRDGTMVATSGYDGNVRIWNAQGGELLRTLQGGGGTIWTIVFSADDRLLASGGEDKIVRVWRVADGSLEKEFKGHTLNVWSVQFSPDGKWVASGSFDHSVRMWSLDGSAPDRVLNGHTQAVVRVAFSPDGKLLASGGDDSKLRLWEVSSGRQVREMDQSPRHIDALAFSPDGSYIVTGGKDQNMLGEILQNFFGENAAGGKGPSMRIWRREDGTLMQTLAAHANDVFGIDFSPDGQWMASASEDKSAIVWRVEKQIPQR
jgi:WD40 repeat protein